MSNQESVKKLKRFKNLISDYFDGKYEDERKLKTEINYLLPIAQTLVTQANCLKMMTMAPPPAIGGMVIQNFNPFDMIFHSFWGTSIIPEIINMVEQSISKYENNLVAIEDHKKQIKEYQGSYPDKITIKWLQDHVPIGIWGTFIGLLVTAFLMGLALNSKLNKISEFLKNSAG